MIISLSLCISSLTTLHAGVRNDRNKKKKKNDEVTESLVIPTEIEDILQEVLRAHRDTFPQRPLHPIHNAVSSGNIADRVWLGGGAITFRVRERVVEG